ncbi:rCG29819 [Rattus norvegicus]|uniref:RCG29819 n=1 Tax=Rattus norvegicus TaxID=10116 RepID=A6ILB6_RAT|nr:rCG29819 [Rattus norvegicus]
MKPSVLPYSDFPQASPQPWESLSPKKRDCVFPVVKRCILADVQGTPTPSQKRQRKALAQSSSLTSVG